MRHMMKIRYLPPTIAALSAALVCSVTLAQSWPTKPVRIVVPAPAGSSLDFVSRVLSDKLKDKWGQSVVVDPKPGAGGADWQRTDVVGNELYAMVYFPDPPPVVRHRAVRR